MKHKIVSSADSSRLILIFAGWGMDSRPFEKLHRPGYDVAVVWDYRSFTDDWSWTDSYSEICVIAWSFGVYASAMLSDKLRPKVTLNIAVNGTLYPCDDSRGIPRAIFDGTLKGLCEQSLIKFYRRMCGSADSYRSFESVMPKRDIEGLKDELAMFSIDKIQPCKEALRFDLAIIGNRDAIIPPDNQARAWSGTENAIVDQPHAVDFQEIIDKYIVDKERVFERFTMGFKSYDQASDVQLEVVDRLEALLRSHGIWDQMSRKDVKVLEVGSGTGQLSLRLDRAVTDGYFEMWDLVGTSCLADRTFRRVDAETEIATLGDNTVDLIVSASTVQWFNSPLRFLDECVRVCRPGGFVAITTFVSGNLAEVSSVTGRSLPLLSSESWKRSVPAGAELIDCLEWDSVLTFDNAIDVFRHLKDTGVNALGRTAGGESSLIASLRGLKQNEAGRFDVTYKPIIMIFKKK